MPRASRAMPFLAGACVLDVTPPAGLAMAGFAARTEPALGAHDPLTVRALAVNDTAIVTADVIGLSEASCGRIRTRSGLPGSHVIVTATHTHGGPAVLPGRLGASHDAAYLLRLENACVEAISGALARRQPARLLYGEGADPGVARNRRQPGGLVDPRVPVLRVETASGEPIAIALSYACHPVTLGPGNLHYTADYPGAARGLIESRWPGAVALFLTGCAGDLNTGHSAQASFSKTPDARRTFAEAERIGQIIAECALDAALRPVEGAVSAHASEVLLRFERREQDLPALAARWRAEAAAADAGRAAILKTWAGWAETTAAGKLTPWRARAAALQWGSVTLAALPGEIFAATGAALRQNILARGAAGAMTLAYANGCPGYFPPRDQYASGGYEVDEAHRFYGLPAAFQPGSAEALADAVLAMLDLPQGAVSVSPKPKPI